MNFLTEVIKEITEAENKTEIASKIEKCKGDISKCNDEILKLEEEFKKSLDREIPKKINELRKNIEGLETEIELLNKMLSTDVVIKPKVDIIKELEEEYKKSSIYKLKCEIINSQRKYLDTLEVYSVKIREMSRVKKEISKIGKNIDEETLSKVKEWYGNKENDLILDIEPISSRNNRTEAIEKEAIRQIDITLDSLRCHVI